MIHTLQHREQYEEFLTSTGVGSKDTVANSVKSYVCYLGTVSRYLGVQINPKTLCTENHVVELGRQLAVTNQVASTTVEKCKTAMRRYIEMVNAERLA